MSRLGALGILLFNLAIFQVVIEGVSIRNIDILSSRDLRHMNDVYDTLNKNNVWNRMETWQRPISPQQEVSQVKDLPEALDVLELNEFYGKVYNDNEKNCEILVLDFNATFEVSVLSVGLHHVKTYIDMVENKCGLGICFIHEHKGTQHRLIVVQNKNYIQASVVPLVVFSMIPSLKDTINIELHPPGRQPRPTENSSNTSSYNTPAYTIQYEQTEDLVFDTATSPSSVDIVTRVTTNDGNVLDSSMSAYMETGTDYTPRILTQVNPLREKHGVFNTRVDLTDVNGNNGVLTTNMILNSRGNPLGLSIYINIKRLYMIHPNSVSHSQPLEMMTMLYGKEEYNVTEGDVLEFGSLVYNQEPPSLTWQKNSASGWKPISGFELNTFPYKYITATMAKSFSISAEDSGEYMVQATSGGITKNVTYKLNIFEEHVEIESERRERGNSLVFICKSKGRPRPSIEFLETNHFAVPKFIQRPEVVLTSNDIFEIGPLDTSGELTTRQITINSFPNPTESGQGSFAVKCISNNGYETDSEYLYIYEYEMNSVNMK